MDNLFAAIPAELPEEQVDRLLTTSGFALQRIVSRGHCTPEGEWYDQSEAEFVVLLSGAARLKIEGEAGVRQMGPGDMLHLQPHCRHRVEWTDPEQESVWLALHYPSMVPGPPDPLG